MEKTLEELQKEQKEIQDKIKELEEKGKDASKEELKTLIAKLDDISAEVKSLSDSNKENDKNASDDASKTLEELDATKKQLQEKEDALNKKEGEVTKLSEDIKALTETVTKLMESNKALEDENYKKSVSSRIENFKKLGAFPSTLKVIEKVALSDNVRKFSVKLSEKTEDGKEYDVKKTFFDVMDDILTSVPQEYRFTESEVSESPRTSTGSSKELSLEDVEKYAKENSITFEEALVYFSKEGKIE